MGCPAFSELTACLADSHPPARRDPSRERPRRLAGRHPKPQRLGSSLWRGTRDARAHGAAPRRARRRPRPPPRKSDVVDRARELLESHGTSQARVHHSTGSGAGDGEDEGDHIGGEGVDVARVALKCWAPWSLTRHPGRFGLPTNRPWSPPRTARLSASASRPAICCPGRRSGDNADGAAMGDEDGGDDETPAAPVLDAAGPRR